MNRKKLELLIAQGESETLEFKKSTAQLRGAVETLCGFLNNKPGLVLIGVTDSGKIVGQNVTQTTRREIAQIQKELEPSVVINQEEVDIGNDKKVLILKANVVGNQKGPYTFRGRPFIRTGSTTSVMPMERFRNIVGDQFLWQHPWDEQVDDNFRYEDLDFDAILDLIRRGYRLRRVPHLTEDPIEVIQKLNLVKEGKLTRAALVLFGRERVFQSGYLCTLKLGRFRGSAEEYWKCPLLDNKELRGNLFELFHWAEDFIRQYLPISSEFPTDQLERVDTLHVPSVAFREALINAIAHGNYHPSGAYVSVAIFDDAMEICNNGELVGITIEELSRKHKSVLRNRLIAESLFLGGYIEKWGSGTLKMLSACREQGMPNPKFYEMNRVFGVRFLYSHSIAVVESGVEDEKSLQHLEPKQKELFGIIREGGAVSLSQIIANMKEPLARRTVQDHLSLLKEKGFVDFKGRGRGAVWVVTCGK